MGRSRHALWQASELGLLDRPPGWVSHALVVALGLYTLWYASAPGQQLLVSAPAALWTMTALLWSVRLTLYNFRLLSPGKKIAKGSRWRWSMAPVIGFLALGVACLDLSLEPRRLRVRSHGSPRQMRNTT